MKPVLLLLAALFVGMGILILKKKRFGPEEGLRGNIIQGRSACIFGIIHILVGAILLAVYLVF